MSFVLGSAERRSRSPKCPGMAVLRTFAFQPMSLMTHEISKATTFLIKSMPQKREVDAGQTLELLLSDLTRRFLQEQGEDEVTGIVVGAVSLREIRHIKDRVLKNAGGIGHPKQVIEFERWQLIGPIVERSNRESLARGI